MQKTKYEFLQILGCENVTKHNIIEVPEGYQPISVQSLAPYAGRITFHFVREYKKPMSKRQERLLNKAEKLIEEARDKREAQHD